MFTNHWYAILAGFFWAIAYNYGKAVGRKEERKNHSGGLTFPHNWECNTEECGLKISGSDKRLVLFAGEEHSTLMDHDGHYIRRF